MNDLRPGIPVVVCGIVLIPVERMRIDSRTAPFLCHATKEAVAVVYRIQECFRALDLEGRERPLEALIEDVPGLGSMLESFPPGHRVK